MNGNLQQRLALAHRLADAAGAAIVPHFRKPIAVDGKNAAGGRFDPVTEADRAAETAMRKLIAETYPDDAILGEEFGDAPGTSPYRWVLDPLDGTRSFVAGLPLWGTLIALQENGRTVLGILDQPYMRERFTGFDGKTEFRNADGARALKTRPCAALSDAVLSTTHPLVHFGEDERRRFHRVEAAAKLSRYGGDCYAYGLLAMGFIDLVIEAHLRIWDSAALIPIVEGAGGIVSDWQGGPVADGGNIIAAGDKRVHAEALKLLTG